MTKKLNLQSYQQRIVDECISRKNTVLLLDDNILVKRDSTITTQQPLQLDSQSLSESLRFIALILERASAIRESSYYSDENQNFSGKYTLSIERCVAQAFKEITREHTLSPVLTLNSMEVILDICSSMLNNDWNESQRIVENILHRCTPAQS